MKPLCCLDNPSIPIVVDASAAINLNATGHAVEILTALPHDLLIVDVVVSQELTNGRCKGRDDADLTLSLVEAGLLQIVRLGEPGLFHFEQLVSGSAEHTIDDGEAATVAFAVETEAIALIDERKATRICAERFTGLTVATTVDLFAHPDVQRALGQETLAKAVFNALQKARMSVQSHHLDWVVNLIGPERVALCSSLPKSIRAGCSAYLPCGGSGS